MVPVAFSKLYLQTYSNQRALGSLNFCRNKAVGFFLNYHYNYKYYYYCIKLLLLLFTLEINLNLNNIKDLP